MSKLYQFGSLLSNQLARPSLRLFSQSVPVSIENGLLGFPEGQSVSSVASFSTARADLKLSETETASKPKQTMSPYMLFKTDFKKTLIESGKPFEKQNFVGLAKEAWEEMDEAKRQPYVYLSIQDEMRKKQVFKAEAKHQDAPEPMKPAATVRSDAYFAMSMKGKGLKLAEIMEKWDKMSIKERKPFEELHKKDQLRYKEEREKYVIKLKDYQKSLEPVKPKMAVHAFLHFNSHQFAKNKGSGKAGSVVVAESAVLWNKMSQKDKKIYLDLEAKDKIRHAAEMKKYELELKKYQKTLGPVKPKKATSAYMYFTSTMFKKHEGSGKSAAAVVSEISKLWKNMPEKEKRRFQDLEAKDKVRHAAEMEKYELELSDHQKSLEQT